jgi:hypothetical protein
MVLKTLFTGKSTTWFYLGGSFKEMVDLHIKDCERKRKSAEKSYKGMFWIFRQY